MKQKPVIEIWPKPSVNLRLFDSHCSHKLMDILLNKIRSRNKRQNFVTPPLVSPWNNVHRTEIEFYTNDRSLSIYRSCFWLVAPCGNLPQTKRITFQIWVVICHQYRNSALLPQTLLRGIPKCRLLKGIL